jgi:hypothetical protein
MTEVMKAQGAATLATAREDLKSAHRLIWGAARALHFGPSEFARLVCLSNELETEIEYLGEHLSERNQVSPS